MFMKRLEDMMDQEKRATLEARLKETLKEHQREGLNIIGNVDQLLARLIRAVEEWVEGEAVSRKRSA